MGTQVISEELLFFSFIFFKSQLSGFHNVNFFCIFSKLLTCVFISQNLFGNKPAGFGTTTTSAPSFGTGTGLFANKPTLTLGANTNTSTFGESLNEVV